MGSDWNMRNGGKEKEEKMTRFETGSDKSWKNGERGRGESMKRNEMRTDNVVRTHGERHIYVFRRNFFAV